MSDPNHPSTTASGLSQAAPFKGVPEITDVHYDLWVLRITLRFENRQGPVYVQFHNTYGFRVLDEGDLTEFWSPDTRPPGWLWHISRGGWLDLEQSRPTFLSGRHSGCNEYLVGGLNDCVSVLSATEPTILDPDTPS
jgi:hypothetical protein